MAGNLATLVWHGYSNRSRGISHAIEFARSLLQSRQKPEEKAVHPQSFIVPLNIDEGAAKTIYGMHLSGGVEQRTLVLSREQVKMYMPALEDYVVAASNNGGLPHDGNLIVENDKVFISLTVITDGRENYSVRIGYILYKQRQ